MITDTLILRLSQEELVYLLRALHIPALPGLESHPLGKLDADHQALALAVADRALRARGGVNWETEEKRHVDSTLAGMLCDCAQPRYTLHLDILHTDKVKLQYLLCFGSNATIEHCIPEPGVHQFVVLPSPEVIIEHLFTMLAIEETRQSLGDAGRLSQEILDAALAAASSNPEEVIRMLATELSLETASGLASVIQNPKMMQYLSLRSAMPGNSDDCEPVETLMVIQGDAGLFLLLKEKADIPQMKVIPATAPLVREYIKKLVCIPQTKCPQDVP